MQQPQLAKFFPHSLPNGKTALISSFGDFSVVSKAQLKQIAQEKISPQLQKHLEKDLLLFTPKNKKHLIKKTRQRFSHVFEGISLHIVNPTLRCNMACQYCYANTAPAGSKKKGLDLDLRTAKKTLDFIWQSPSKSIVIEFQGGEPLANFPAIEFIVNEAKRRKGKRVHFRIVTNLTLMDETIARFLQRHKLWDVCTSLDGPKKVHDKNRALLGGGSTYRAVSHWINALKTDFSFSHVGMLPTITKHSLPYPKEIVDEYLSHGMQDIIPVMLRRIGRAKENWGKIGYSAEQYIQFWKRLTEYCIALTKRGKPIAEQYSLLTLRKILLKEPVLHTCFSKPCGAALMQASYLPDGSIYTCDEAKAEPLFRLGSVEQAYPQVFTSPAALNMVSLSSTFGTLCNECKWNAYCRFCPVLTYSSTGSPFPVLPLDMDCRVKKVQISFTFNRLFSKDRPVLLQWLRGKN